MKFLQKERISIKSSTSVGSRQVEAPNDIVKGLFEKLSLGDDVEYVRCKVAVGSLLLELV